MNWNPMESLPCLPIFHPSFMVHCWMLIDFHHSLWLLLGGVLEDPRQYYSAIVLNILWPDTISLPLVFSLTFYTLVEDAHFAQSLNLSVLSSRQGIKTFIFSRKKRKTNETYLRARVNQYPWWFLHHFEWDLWQAILSPKNVRLELRHLDLV